MGFKFQLEIMLVGIELNNNLLEIDVSLSHSAS